MATVNETSLVAMRLSFNSRFNDGFKAAPKPIGDLCMEIPSTGRSEVFNWLDMVPALTEWVGDRKLIPMAAGGYTITPRKWERSLEVDRIDIEDDQLGLYGPKVQMLSARAAQHIDKLAAAILVAGHSTIGPDGQYFFDTDHPITPTEGAATTAQNYNTGAYANWFLVDNSQPIKPLITVMRKRAKFVARFSETDENVFMRDKFQYGVDGRWDVGFGFWQYAFMSKEALSSTTLQANISAMKGFTDNEGEPLDIAPTHLLVPPSLEPAARALLLDDLIATGDGSFVSNTCKGLIKIENLIVSARLA